MRFKFAGFCCFSWSAAPIFWGQNNPCLENYNPQGGFILAGTPGVLMLYADSACGETSIFNVYLFVYLLLLLNISGKIKTGFTQLFVI